MNKTKAASESKVVEATLSAGIVLRDEIRLAVDKERLLSRQEQEKLQMTIDELRHSIQRSEAQLNRKEQMLRQEINDLRQVSSRWSRTQLSVEVVRATIFSRDFKKLNREMKNSLRISPMVSSAIRQKISL